MACRNCGSGGCGTTPAGCRNNGNCGTSGCNKLDVFDWLVGMHAATTEGQFVEVRFKNTRKEFFRNPNRVEAHVGDAVVVESLSGMDVGAVSLMGELVQFQMRKHQIKPDPKSPKKLLRKAGENDIKMWQAAQERERETLVKTRKIIRQLKLDMKLTDVEFQADGSRATFYYTADDRVDFRELIKVLADQFRIRVDMKQIGSRQEAGLVGGIGSCGRELCCSTWLTDFRTVSTNAARYQQLSINPMKLAGQCGKLKCCLNYELDAYMDALKDFPDSRVKLKTKKGVAFHQKSDIFRGMMWYSYKDSPNEFIPLKIDRVKEVIALNESGKDVDDLKGFSHEETPALIEPLFENAVGQDSLTRFDRQNKDKKRQKPNKNRGRNQGKKPSGQGQNPQNRKL